MTQTIYSTAQNDTSFVVPSGVTSITVKIWGAGGGGGGAGGVGGGGGFVQGDITTTPAETLKIDLGGGGAGGSAGFGATGGAGGQGSATTAAGGAVGGGKGAGDSHDGGGGGGGYGVVRRSTTVLIKAGGGGSGLVGSGGVGGGGGGSSGQNGANGTGGTGPGGGGTGASGSAVGTGGAGSAAGANGSGVNGGAGGIVADNDAGGGGGGGGGQAGGGGGGAGDDEAGAGGGGGGSSDLGSATSTTSTQATGQNAANEADVDWAIPAGKGGNAGTNGEVGRIVLDYAAGGNVTRDPPQGDLVLTTVAPTVDEAHVQSPPQAVDLVIDGKVPVQSVAVLRSAPQGDLALSTAPPIPLINRIRAAPQADLALDPKTPAIAGATWKAALNTGIVDVELDTLCHIVFELDHNGAAEANYAAQLEYNVVGAGWNDVTATSLNIRATDSTRIADGTDVPRLLGSGTYLSANAGYDEVDGASGGANLDWPEDATITEVNVQFAWVARSADLSGGENIALRVKGLEAYDHTANLTIVVSAEANGRHAGLLRNVGKMMR